MSGTDVSYGGIVIGTVAGGVGASLIVTFNAAASSAAVDALIENLTYADVSDTPTASRALALDIVDGAGAHVIAARAFVELAGGNPLASGLPGLGFFPALAFVDVDHDGALDFVFGDGEGRIRYFQHAPNGDYFEWSGIANPFDGFNNDHAAPAAIDFDDDGDMDLAVGEYNRQDFRLPQQWRRQLDEPRRRGRQSLQRHRFRWFYQACRGGH